MPEPIFFPMRGVPYTLLSAVSAAAPGTAIAIPPSFLHHKIYIIGSAGVASGAVTLETADDPAYAGLWAPLQAAVTVLASTELIIDYTGAIAFLRARVSTIIGSGTVTVKYLGDAN